MERTITRGNVVLGTILFPEATCMGLEVFARSAFPESTPDGDDQFESADRAERFLNQVYEAHCEAAGITPVPANPEIDEASEEAAYIARMEAAEAAELAYHVAQQEAALEFEATTRTVNAPWDALWSDGEPVLSESHLEQLRGFENALPRAPEAPAASDDSSDDDLPF